MLRHDADHFTWGGNGIKSSLGSIFNGYWVASVVDTALTTAFNVTLTAAGISPLGIGAGIAIAGMSAGCEYYVHVTQDKQSQDNHIALLITNEKELENVNLSCSRQLHLKGAFVADALSIAGGFSALLELGVMSYTGKKMPPLTKLLSSFGTFAIGCYAAYSEYRTHKTSQQRAQLEEDQNKVQDFQRMTIV